MQKKRLREKRTVQKLQGAKLHIVTTKIEAVVSMTYDDYVDSQSEISLSPQQTGRTTSNLILLCSE